MVKDKLTEVRQTISQVVELLEELSSAKNENDEHMAKARLYNFCFELGAAQALIDMAQQEHEKLLEQSRETIFNTRSLVIEATLLGFNYKNGDWVEQLYSNNGKLTDTLKKLDQELGNSLPFDRTMPKTYKIMAKSAIGKTFECFTWLRTPEQGIERAKRDAKDHGVIVTEVWAEEI